MNTAQPIRKVEDLNRIKAYYKWVNPQPRNYLLIIMGLNTALRISDILQLKWEDVYNFRNKEMKEHIIIVEQKTGKNSSILVNSNLKEALWGYRKYLLEERKKHAKRIIFLKA